MTSKAILKKHLKRIGARQYVGDDLDFINQVTKNIYPFEQKQGYPQVRIKRNVVERTPQGQKLFEYGNVMAVVEPLNDNQKQDLKNTLNQVKIKSFGNYDIIEY